MSDGIPFSSPAAGEDTKPAATEITRKGPQAGGPKAPAL